MLHPFLAGFIAGFISIFNIKANYASSCSKSMDSHLINKNQSEKITDDKEKIISTVKIHIDEAFRQLKENYARDKEIF